MPQPRDSPQRCRLQEVEAFFLEFYKFPVRISSSNLRIYYQRKTSRVTIGIGIDLIELNRIQASLKRFGDRLKGRIFTEDEIAYCDAKGSNAFRHYAARFSAKEAVMKALGLGWQKGTSWKEIEVFRNKNGQPQIRLTGSTAHTALKLKSKRILLSLTHSEHYAAAFVIIEG
jgi:holo-[acyl-carrier protein] synthase